MIGVSPQLELLEVTQAMTPILSQQITVQTAFRGVQLMAPDYKGQGVSPPVP